MDSKDLAPSDRPEGEAESRTQLPPLLRIPPELKLKIAAYVYEPLRPCIRDLPYFCLVGDYVKHLQGGYLADDMFEVSAFRGLDTAYPYAVRPDPDDAFILVWEENDDDGDPELRSTSFGVKRSVQSTNPGLPHSKCRISFASFSGIFLLIAIDADDITLERDISTSDERFSKPNTSASFIRSAGSSIFYILIGIRHAHEADHLHRQQPGPAHRCP